MKQGSQKENNGVISTIEGGEIFFKKYSERDLSHSIDMTDNF